MNNSIYRIYRYRNILRILFDIEAAEHTLLPHI